MPEAARVGDPIAHTQAMSGLLIGLAAGAALAVVTVATGGLGGVIVAAAIAGGAAGGGLAGAYIGETIMGSPSGAVAVGSPNVFINRLVPVDNSLIFISFVSRLRAKRTDSLTNRFFLLSIRPV